MFFFVRTMSLAARGGSSPTTRRNRGRASRYRPCLEALEDRCTPATFTWTGAASNLWSDPGNWAGGAVPVSSGPSNQPGTDLVFPAGAGHLSNVNDLVQLTVDNLSIQGDGYRLAGNGLTFHTDLGGVSNAAGNNTVALAVGSAVTGPFRLFVSAAAGTTLNLAGPIDVGTSGMTVTGPGGVNFSGNISGRGDVRVGQRAGPVSFGGIGLYFGDTFLSGFQTVVTNGQAFGTGTVHLGEPTEGFTWPGTLTCNVPLTLANAFAIGPGDGYLQGNAALTLTGPVALTGKLYLQNTGTTTLTGTMSGAGRLEFGGGTVVLSGANSYSGGTQVGGNLIVGSDTALGTGMVNFFSGRVDSSADVVLRNPFQAGGGIAFAVSRALTLAGPGTLTGNVSIPAAGTVTFSGPLSGPGAFNKVGRGTLILSSVDTFTGTNHFVLGDVLINGTLIDSHTLFVSGRLGGTGLVSNLAAVGNGVIRPGTDSPSKLKVFLPAAPLSTATTLAIRLNGPGPGTSYDQFISSVGPIDLGHAKLQLTRTANYAPKTVLIIVYSNDGLHGTFAGLPDGATVNVNGQRFRINYSPNSMTLTALARLQKGKAPAKVVENTRKPNGSPRAQANPLSRAEWAVLFDLLHRLAGNGRLASYANGAR